jgi:hypothetical protein
MRVCTRLRIASRSVFAIIFFSSYQRNEPIIPFGLLRDQRTESREQLNPPPKLLLFSVRCSLFSYFEPDLPAFFFSFSPV